MSDDEPTGEQVAHGVMAQGQLARLQSYLERGRKLEELSAEQLRAYWVRAARAWAETPFEPPIAQDDATAEYALRKVVPPYDLVRDDIEKAIAAITARAKQMTDDERQEVNAAMTADFKRDSKARN